MADNEKNISDAVEMADCPVKLLKLDKKEVYILFERIYFMDLGGYVNDCFIFIKSDFPISVIINGENFCIEDSDTLNVDVIQSVSVSDEDLTLGGFMKTGEWLEIFVKKYKFFTE